MGLPVAEKPDSQDFYEGDYNDLLKTTPKEGYIKDVDGKILATHQGFWNYTIGQRKGLGIAASAPLYVLSLDAETNTVVVGYKDKTFKKSLVASSLNFVSYDYIPDKKLSAKIRSSQQPQEVSAKLKDGCLYVEFDEYQKSIAPGQSVVIYDEDTLVMGGVIESAK